MGKKSRKRKVVLEKLTDELLLEILTRLPVEDAIKYKVVCKEWRSLISSTYFMTRLIDHHDASKTFTLVFQDRVVGSNWRHPVEAVSNHPVLCKSYAKKYLDLSFLTWFNKSRCSTSELLSFYESVPPYVEASCNDLLLVSRVGTYSVVNLVTGEWITLPHPPQEPHSGYIRNKAGLLRYQDDGSYRFKVILVLFPLVHSSHATHSIIIVRVYCSYLKQWTRVIVDGLPLGSGFMTPIVAHDAKWHWFTGSYLVTLDPFSADEKPITLSSTIKLPHQVFHDKLSCFGVCLGHLRIACRYSSTHYTIHVWELADYQTGSLSKMHEFAMDKLVLNPEKVALLAFHPYHQDIIFLELEGTVQSFNMKTREFQIYRDLPLLEDYRIHPRQHALGVFTVVPPLLHQWFSPTPLK